MRVREFVAADWPKVWPIVREVIQAEETFPYDPAMDSAQARDIWVVAPPGIVAVAEEDGEILGTAHMQANRPAGTSGSCM